MMMMMRRIFDDGNEEDKQKNVDEIISPLVLW
jgi:hypothetical protein